MREQVEADERLLRQLVDETPDLVFVKDRDGRYVLANPASAMVAGHSVDEILGHTDDEVFPPELARNLRAIDRRILATGVPETYDESFVVAGEVRHFSTAKMPQRDGDRPPWASSASRAISPRANARRRRWRRWSRRTTLCCCAPAPRSTGWG